MAELVNSLLGYNICSHFPANHSNKYVCGFKRALQYNSDLVYWANDIQLWCENVS